MTSLAQSSAQPLPLDASQVSLVLELLDMRRLAPKETAARFFQLGHRSGFSIEQRDVVEWLFELDESQVAGMLMNFADDEARAVVREQLAYEARLDYVLS